MHQGKDAAARCEVKRSEYLPVQLLQPCRLLQRVCQQSQRSL